MKRVITKDIVRGAVKRLLNLFPEDVADDIMLLKLRTQLADRLGRPVMIDPLIDPHHIDGTVLDEPNHKIRFHIDL